MQIRDAVEADFGGILALNEAEVVRTSPMDRARLSELDRLAAVHWVAEVEGQVVAFLLAMREGVAYDSENYRWFAERHARFLYVDRIVVDAAHAGQGIGARLYRRLFDHACANGIAQIACEYNLEPPNPASQAFHARFGFVGVGQQQVAGGHKTVSLQLAAVPVQAD